MSNVVVVHKGRTNIIPVSIGLDVSTELVTSQIRTEPDQDAPLIATWQVDFETDGTDGEIILTLPASITELIVENRGYMDLKRGDGEGSLPIFNRPLEVEFRGTVTV